jgi:hypothetical protein
MSKLDDLPSLSGPGARKQKHTEFDDFGFEDDLDDSAGASSNKKPVKQPESKFTKAQKQLMEHDEEENVGYNMRMKAPSRQAKSNFEVYAEDIEEDIESEHDHDQHTHGKDSESGRGFGITVS